MKTYYSVKIDSEYNTTVVAFGGIANQLMMPVFEFFNILSQFKVNKIFVKDPHQSWYYKLGHSKITEELIEIIPKENRKIFIGTSAGGFAAILIGNLIGADLVLAFSPQTFLDPVYRREYKDNRWSKEIKNVYEVTKNLYDLRLPEMIVDNNTTEYRIYYCDKFELDVVHASMLAEKNNFIMEPQDCAEHVVVKCLKQSNLLLNILEENLNGISS
jgi:hypothetical protein